MLTRLLDMFRKPKPRSLEDEVMEIQKGIREGTLRTIPYFSDSVDSGAHKKYSIGNTNMREEFTS